MTPVNDLSLVLVISIACALAVGGLGWTLLRQRGMRTLRTTIAVATVCSVLTVVAGVLATAQAMFLSTHDFGVVLLVCAAGGAVAVVLGLLLARQVVGESRTVQDAAHAMADGDRLRLPMLPRTVELAAVARQLEATSHQWADSRDREAALEASRRELVAWVSHDLRTPLAGLRAMAEALEDGVAQDPPRYLRRIRSDVDQLSAMVDDLFHLSRLQAGEVALNREPVALGDLVSDTLSSTEALARERGVTLHGRASEQITLQADPHDLSRVLGNLVVNAIRHTADDGSVQVDVRRSGPMAIISVQDECGGIPAPDLPKVFDVAWRGTHARTPGGDGRAGLGLAIVRGIVVAHRGSVRVVNTQGGCRFEVRLPVGP